METEEVDGALARKFQLHLHMVFAQLANSGVGFAQDGGVVAAAQAAVGTDHQEQRGFHSLVGLQQRMMDIAGTGTQVGGQLGDLPGVGLGLDGAVHGFAKARGGDQLHGPRNLADVTDRFAPFDKGFESWPWSINFLIGEGDQSCGAGFQPAEKRQAGFQPAERRQASFQPAEKRQAGWKPAPQDRSTRAP